eukprot:1144939-Pelagomonas_calceolata.AAC.3
MGVDKPQAFAVPANLAFWATLLSTAQGMRPRHSHPRKLHYATEHGTGLKRTISGRRWALCLPPPPASSACTCTCTDLLSQEAHGGALVQQTQLAIGVLLVAWVAVDATVQQGAVEVTHLREDAGQ